MSSSPSKSRVERLRTLVQERLREVRRTKRLLPPIPPPRYDEVFARGRQWLDRMAAGDEEP